MTCVANSVGAEKLFYKTHAMGMLTVGKNNNKTKKHPLFKFLSWLAFPPFR